MTASDEQSATISVVIAKLRAHKERCRGSFRGTLFLDGADYYNNTYTCSVCADRLNEQGSTKRGAKRLRAYYDNKDGRWYE